MTGLDSGQIEAIKWVACALMVLDHVNYALFGSKQVWMYELGRMAMPLFVFVCAYHLARPRPKEESAKSRRAMMAKMLVFGVASLLPSTLMRGTTLPLNIMFSLALFVAFVHIWSTGAADARSGAIAMLLILGPFVDYAWIVPVLGWTWMRYIQKDTLPRLLLLMAAMALLAIGNQSLSGFGAFVVIAIIARLRSLKVPRSTYGIYLFYPVHQLLILGVKAIL